jgi:small-conductance mechanosensitive channel
MNFELLRPLLDNFLSLVPRIGGALLLLVLGWIIASVLSSVMRRVCGWIQLDKWAGKINEIEIIRNANINFSLTNVLAKLAYYAVMLVTLVAVADTMKLPMLSELIVNILNYIPNFLLALLVLSAGMLLANFVKGLVASACETFHVPYGNLISNVVFYSLFITVAISAMAQAGIDTTFISSNISIILSGLMLAIGIGSGLAAKGMMENVFAAMANKQIYSIGNEISVGGVRGSIVEMTPFNLVLQTATGPVVITQQMLNSSRVEVLSQKPMLS